MSETREGRRFDLLAEDLIRVRGPNGRTVGRNLPQILAGLASGEEMEFRQLQPHQEHAWHAFLVQISAMAMARNDLDQAPDDVGDWRNLLLGLSGGSESAWCLVVEDLAEPAFFQAPIPEGSLTPLKKEGRSPDDIGVLVTAKNHDVKWERFHEPAADDWIFALVTLQTTEGFSGRMNYGIARMNGGFGSRPQIAAATGLGWSDRFGRDLRTCLEWRETVLAGDWDYPAEGKTLLWLEGWDGKESLDIRQLDPYFVEICRRVRLALDGEEIRVHFGTSKAPRVEARDLLGNLGDAWTPIREKDAAALTVSDRGFDYRKLAELIFPGTFLPAAAQALKPKESGVPSFVARVLVRGQGQTGGYHERIVPLHKKVARRMAEAEGRVQLGTIAEERIEKAREAQNRVLKPAILTLHQGAPESLNFQDPAADEYIAELDRIVDREFFERLWRDHDAESDDRKARWQRFLFSEAKKIFDRAIERAPSPDARYYKAVAAAERTFYGAAKRVLKAAFSDAKDDDTHDPEGEKDAA